MTEINSAENENPEPRGWLVMVRHTAVDENLQGVCYGASDVDLSPAGLAHNQMLSTELAALAPTHIIHSGLSRTRLLAEAVAEKLGTNARPEPRLREFNFGEWELKRWDDIHAAGHDIARLIHEPSTFSAPDGETLFQMRDRVLAWYGALATKNRVLAISHGGPISALRGSLSGAPPHVWPTLVPAYGADIRFALPG
ncbi:MAG: histidine phosphatase family protein [Alphaproteobacteria bacterium]|nr:histidine phosphatase family protein [Alphaproteobacteria bacterium]